MLKVGWYILPEIRIINFPTNGFSFSEELQSRAFIWHRTRWGPTYGWCSEGSERVENPSWNVSYISIT